MQRTVLILLALWQVGLADSLESLFQQGVQAYQRGDYAEAVEHWQNAVRQGRASAALYYNLANAYFKIDDIGRAVLYYERARRLAPGDEDIDFNLGVAKLRTVDKIASPEIDYFYKLFNRLKNMLSLPQWTWLVVGLYILLTALLIIRLLARGGLANFLAPAVTPVLIVLLIAGSFFFLRVREDVTVKEAVVLDQNAAVLAGPQRDATEVFVLHEGAQVRIIDRSGEYLRIRLSDGKDGWILGGALEAI